jgi:hypothetical protein
MPDDCAASLGAEVITMRSLGALLALLAASSGCEPHVVAPATVNTVTALFDPTAAPPVVPTPNDLAFIGGDGVHLNVPDEPGQSPAQLAFNAYLRSLTGYPPSSTANASFSAAIDPATAMAATATGGSIFVIDTTAGMPVGGLVITVAADGKSLSIANPKLFTSGHRYSVMLLGGSATGGLHGAKGELVVASPAFFFLRSPTPLLQRCANLSDPSCACPAAAVANPTDTTCHSAILGLSDAQARQAEPQRQMLNQALTQLLPLIPSHPSRDNVVLFWTFTITSQPVAEFDPISGAVPFPNDVLIDQTTGKVSLPFAPGDPMAPLKMQLNTLDGFSVSAAATLPVDVAKGVTLDAATILPHLSVQLITLDGMATGEPPDYDAAASFGQVAITPRLPLESDQQRYVAVVTRDVTAGGAPLVPAPTTALILQPNPLFDGKHATVSVLDDATAKKLEALRAALQPLVGAFQSQGLPPERIAALWTFTTQSVARPLLAADAFPTQSILSTDVTLGPVVHDNMFPPALQPQFSHVKAVIVGSFTSQLIYDPTTRVVNFTRTPSPTNPTTPAADKFTLSPAMAIPATIRFWLTLPKNSPGPNGAPIVIVQHGLGSWRGDVLTLADDFAAGNSAAIGFDIDFHGARSKCTADNQCASGAAGSCNTSNGTCTGGYVVNTMNPSACILAAFTNDMVNDCEPLISGNGYVDPQNLFGGRAEGWQYVTDAAQLVRVLTAMGGNSLQARLASASLANAINPGLISFLGHSLGAVNGTLFLAADPAPIGGNVLSVGGGHLFEIIADGDFHKLVDGFITQLGITRGTSDYAKLVNTARWVLDPVDPFAAARYVHRFPLTSYVFNMPNTPKLAIVQEAGMDTTIPPQYEAALSLSLWGKSGLDSNGHNQGADRAGDFVSTYFPDANHLTLLTGSPSPTMRVQATTYILSGGVTLPAP